MNRPAGLQRRWGLEICYAAAACLLLGCGGNPDNRALVSGIITLDGEPVESGVITFLAENGPSAGAFIKDGGYSSSLEKGPMIGTNRVQIFWERKTGRQVWSGPPEEMMIDEVVEAIPEKYNLNTTLTIDVKRGRNTYDFRLTTN